MHGHEDKDIHFGGRGGKRRSKIFDLRYSLPLPLGNVTRTRKSEAYSNHSFITYLFYSISYFYYRNTTTNNITMAPTFLPNGPPIVISPQERIHWLQDQLTNPANESQQTNITALINMYETGVLGPLTQNVTIFLCNGEIIPSPEALGGMDAWARSLPETGALWAEVGLNLG